MIETCFECGEPGHMARDCPARLATSEKTQPKPIWCGSCDKETRLVELIRHGRTMMNRCAACHPLAWVPLKQHRRHGGCNVIVYTWDSTECGQHSPLATLR